MLRRLAVRGARNRVPFVRAVGRGVRRCHGGSQPDSDAVRRAFVDFFVEHDHTALPSASVAQPEDPSLMFTAAGMVPFRRHFVGLEPPPAPSIVTAQRCIRAGGKHNDLDHVGYTHRHLTLFEMLGNFSFGSYDKAHAMNLAWTFLTQRLQLDPRKLLVSVYEKDEEAARLWHEHHRVPEDRILRLGRDDNYWSMGNGPGLPCGPCTEIHYELDEPTVDGEHMLELWNIVFMQEQTAFDDETRIISAETACIDTGMGLERLTAVLNGNTSPFATEPIAGLVQHVLALAPDGCGAAHASAGTPSKVNCAYVIADHMRSSVAMLADGVMPSAIGAGYVLRRILRRALRHAHHLGFKKPFMHLLYDATAVAMGPMHEQLMECRTRSLSVLQREEEAFLAVLERGLTMLHSALRASRDVATTPTTTPQLDAGVAFQLLETYGFPLDLTHMIAREQGVAVDLDAVDDLVEEHRKRSSTPGAHVGQAGTAAAALAASPEARQWARDGLCNHFSGYDTLVEHGTRVLAVSPPTEHGTWLVLERSPFYAEAGGQASDVGHVWAAVGSDAAAQVGDTGVVEETEAPEVPTHAWPVVAVASPFNGVTAVCIRPPVGATELLHIERGTRVVARVDQGHRRAVARHHTATHLLHAALRQVVGPHVRQVGSSVTASGLRFDVTLGAPLTVAQLEAVQDWVRGAVEADEAVRTQSMSLDAADAAGAVRLSGAAYASDAVRVVRAGAGSCELCGGTHVSHTSAVGAFAIQSQSAVSSGVRRLTAVAGLAAEAWTDSLVATLQETAASLSVPLASVPKRVQQLAVRVQHVERELKRARDDLVAEQARTAMQNASASEQGKTGHQVSADGVHHWTGAMHLPATGDVPDQESSVHVSIHMVAADAVPLDLRQMATALHKSAVPGAAPRVHVVTNGRHVVAIRAASKPVSDSDAAHAGHVLHALLTGLGGGKGGGKHDYAQGAWSEAKSTAFMMQELPRVVTW